MHSSTVLFLRGLIMLGCLVTIPMAAVLGTSLPGVARSLLDGHLALVATSEGSTVDGSCQFEPMPVGEAAMPLPCESGSCEAPELLPTAGCTSVMPWGTPSRDAVNPVQTVSYEASAGGVGAAPAVPLAAETHAGPWAVPMAAAESAPSDPFGVMQDRLRRMGATYYLLEAWGDQEPLFRFYCRIAVGGNPAYTRHFEATDADPLRAMSEVVRQIDVWRGGWAE